MTCSEKITRLIAGQISLDEDKQQEFHYGLQVFSLTVAGVLIVLVFSWLLHCLPESLTAMLTVALLRSFAGGAHCTSPVRCTIVTAFTFSLLGMAADRLEAWQPFNLTLFVLLNSFLALTAVLLKAPVDSPAKPILTQQHRRFLRRLSFLIVVALAVLQLIFLTNAAPREIIIATGLGMLWEALILTGPGHGLMFVLDYLLKKGGVV